MVEVKLHDIGEGMTEGEIIHYFVKVGDAVKADQSFTILMGEEVEPRKKWIEQNAKDVENLDI